jgi:predicted RNA-binding protein with TRAM domain
MTRPNKGDEYELTIESLAFGGKGVAHLDDGRALWDEG